MNSPQKFSIGRQGEKRERGKYKNLIIVGAFSIKWKSIFHNFLSDFFWVKFCIWKYRKL